jgi:HEAT repeat protein
MKYLRPSSTFVGPHESGPIQLLILVLVWFGCALVSSAEADDEPPAKSLRPIVIATLKTGEVLEGKLHRFADGLYTIVASGRTWHFREEDAKAISFAKPIPITPKSRSPKFDALTTVKLIEAFAHPPAKIQNRSYGDARLISALAGRGAEVIKPLMRAVAENSYLEKNVGKVFQLLGPNHFPALLKELQAGTPGAKAPFYWALQRSGVRSVPVLRALLDHQDEKVRSFALYTLYNIGIQSGTVMATSLTPALLKTLNDPVLAVRKKAPAILAMVAKPIDDILPPLLAAIPADSDSGEIAYECVLALSTLGTKLRKTDPWRVKIDVAMRECLSHQNSSIRSSAAYYFGLQEPPPEATVRALRKAADDPKGYVRKTARETLYKLGISPNLSTDVAQLKKLANDELVKQIANEDTVAAQNAVDVVKTRTASPKLLGLLMELVANDRKSTYWNQVPRIVAAWDADKAVPWLEEYATADSPRVRRIIASAYAMMSLNELPPSLKQLAKDPDMMVRSEAIRTLGKIASQSKGEIFQTAVSLLLSNIQDTSIHREYHWHACDALVAVGVGHPDVLPRIIHLAKKSLNVDLREAMIDALGEIGEDLQGDSKQSHQIVKTLASLLDEEHSADMKIEVIYAFSRMGSNAPLAVSALRKAMDDPRKSVSKAAARALKELSGRKETSDKNPFD